MSRYRPPLGGLFRLQGPAQADARPEARAEARDAIRHFVRVLERLDREVNQPQATPRPQGVRRDGVRRATKTGSKP